MRLLPVLCVLASCHPAPPTPPKPPPGLTGHLAVAANAKVTSTRGPLFVTWMTAEEQAAQASGTASLMLLRDLITRGVVAGEVDASKDVAFTVRPPHGKIVVVAVVDLDHTGVLGVLGGGTILAGKSAAFDVTDTTTAAPPITLALSADEHAPEACKGGRLRLEKIDAPEVAGTIGNSTSRRLCVRLPKDYDAHPDTHYPVIYALPGLFGDDAEMIDAAPEAEGAIVVAVDTSTKSGSTYFANSPTSGAWDTFFATQLVPYVDAHYRTLPRREGRALTGHSTGGYNAMSYGLRHPELFGVIAASSPDGLDFEVWLGSGHVPDWIVAFQRVEHALGGKGQFISYAADWSPTSGGYDWPFDNTGALVDAVAKRWFANTPGTWLRDAKAVGKMKPLSGFIYLTVGDTDEFGLHVPTVAFSKELTAHGIANQLVVTHGGHVTHVTEQLTAAFQFCASKLEAAR